ncbi:hypothetical protein MUP32_01335, partial [Candidatus Microgenomates bacterium]|nr:hypothetical protein [Candidatus Microgenomates bacterium]
NPAKPLFLVSTARLTNDQGTPPQAYLLNKIFDELGLDHTWTGMADVRSATLRTHPTGAVVVKVQPGEYEAIFTKIRDRFNAAAEKMIKENPGYF